MGDDIGSGSGCYCFSLNLRSAAQFVFSGQKMTLERQSVSEPEPMSSPITQLNLHHDINPYVVTLVNEFQLLYWILLGKSKS